MKNKVHSTQKSSKKIPSAAANTLNTQNPQQQTKLEFSSEPKIRPLHTFLKLRFIQRTIDFLKRKKNERNLKLLCLQMNPSPFRTTHISIFTYIIQSLTYYSHVERYKKKKKKKQESLCLPKNNIQKKKNKQTKRSSSIFSKSFPS